MLNIVDSYCPTRIRRRVRHVLAIITGILTVGANSLSGQAPPLSVVAILGDRIAGLAENEVLAGWSFEKGINQNGDVVFTGGISQQDSDGRNSIAGTGIWAGQPGAIELIARDGQALPGEDSDLVFSEILTPLEFNNAGEVAFLARIGPNKKNPEAVAIFVGKKDTLRIIARDGDPAVGFEDFNGRLRFDTEFNLSSQPRLALSDTGDLAWTAGVGAPDLFDWGVWHTSGGETQLISPDSEDDLPEHFSGLSTGPDGSVAFLTHGSLRALFTWNGSELQEIARPSDTIGDSTATWTRLGHPYYQSDGSLYFSATTRPEEDASSERGIWRWKEGEFQVVTLSRPRVITEELVAEQVSLDPIPGISVIPFSACAKHPVNPSRFCTNVLLVDTGTEPRVIAFQGMQFPGEPEGSEIVFDRIPGLIDRNFVANDRGSMVAHLGKRGVDGEVSQGLYRVDDTLYSPIIEQGAVVDFGSAGEATTIRFHLYARVANNRRLRSLNDNDQLLFTVSSEEHRDAMVVTSVRTAPTPTLSVTAQGLALEWDGNGILETSMDVSGPWVEATDQARSQTLNAESPLQFFRVRMQ